MHLSDSQAADFLELVEKHKDEFYRYVLRTAWDKGVADDVFQAAILAAFENYHKFTPGTNFRAWVYRILTNKCFVANRETARSFQPLEDDDARFIAVAAEPGYSDVLKDPGAFLEQCVDEVHRAFGRVSAAERACILLRSVERFSYQEIGEILEMPVGTVMTHLSRGRAKLRRDLLEYARQQRIVRSYPRLIPREDHEVMTHTDKGSCS